MVTEPWRQKLSPEFVRKVDRHRLKEDHKRLHDALDVLVACFIADNMDTEKNLRNTSIMELIEWSAQKSGVTDGLT